MALITQAALKSSRLMKYFGAVHYVMPQTNVKTETVEYNTLHKMMKNTYYKYDGVFAGKTGYELMSGHTLVTAAKRNGKNLICVVMKSGTGNSCYRDTKALLDYCFTLPVQSENAEYLKNPIKGDAVNKIMPEEIQEQKQTAAETNKLETEKKTNRAVLNYKGLILLVMALLCCVFSFAFSITENRKKLCRRLQRKLYLCERDERNINFLDAQHF
jgi:D-alanyl-D-alanine carboxypeptidase